MAKTSDSSGWDQDLSSIVRQTTASKPRTRTNVVRDDWDDEEEEDVDVETEQERDIKVSASGNKTEEDGGSSRIWQEANKRTPMPELIVAPASTSQSVAPPPPAALQPTLRILKRPSPSSSTSNVGATSSSLSGGASPAPRGTLAEREAQYQEARSRIFGEKEKLDGVVVVRDPAGPASEPGLGPARGFGERRGGKK